MSKKVSLFFDVEDPFGELADDAALDVASVFRGCSVRATFCITGEKCRKLLERGRTDVIEAYKSHALGLHTNTHSQHPTTMELLEDKGWEDGCEAAYAAEKPGLDSFREAFGRQPVCWAGAGYSWGPQMAGILPRLGIPAYVYGLTSVGHGRVHQFAGVLSFPITAHTRETEYEDDAATEVAIERALNDLRSSQSDWPIVFCGHPTRMRYSDYWDRAYYRGINPDPYVGVPPKPEATYKRSLANLERVIRAINAEFPVVGLDEAVSSDWRYTLPTAEELTVAAEEAVANIRWRAADWPVHKPHLDTSKIEEHTLARLDTLRIATL